MRVSKNEIINHVGESVDYSQVKHGNSWKLLAEDLSARLGCDVIYSDFGWLTLNIPLADSFIKVILYVEWLGVKGEGLVKGYSKDINTPPFVCGKLRADSFRIDYGSVAARIKSVLSSR